MAATVKCKDYAVMLIAKYYGDTTAEMYKSYYAKKDDARVKDSVSELLTEMLGTKRTEKEMLIFKGL